MATAPYHWEFGKWLREHEKAIFDDEHNDPER
jgi:hypothetical protein